MSHPDEVINALLTSSFWPKGLNTKTRYTRMGDDDQSILSIAFSDDGDGWVEAVSKPDPDLPQASRFRTGMGGGSSHATRNALLILAVAMTMDERSFPQTHHKLDLGVD
jgi:hypothetical protein